MSICAFRSLRLPIPWSLLLALLLLLTLSATVTATSAGEASVPNCAKSGLEPQPVTVQMTQSDERVQTTLHSPPSALPAAGCLVPLDFHIPENARPPYAVWRDVEGRAVQPDGAPDPARPAPLPLRLWIHPDGNLEYEVREAGVKATHAALDLEVAWGTTATANDLAVMDIFSAALGLDLELWELGAGMYDSNRVRYLDWEGVVSIMHVPAIRVGWELPSELGQLTALSRLNLGGPLLRGTIPPELGRLKNLQQLTLAGSRLTGSVPPELVQLSQLVILDLHDNRLTEFPPELVKLPRLWRLNLDDNQLTSLPPELGTMTHLSKLRLARNQLTSLPPELGTMTYLTELGLAGNRLTSLPSELGQLSQLNMLDLAGNRLTTLPPELGHLHQLAFLDVQDNQLTALPSLAGLSQLDYLDLSGNRLTRLPPGLEQIPALSRLDMSDNRLQKLNLVESLMPPFTLPPQAGPFLQQLQQMAKARGVLPTPPLRILDLSGNRLTTLPPRNRSVPAGAPGSVRQPADHAAPRTGSAPARN